MAWTSPMTFVANQVLTAAQLNTHLRDNMLESEVAKATTASGYFVGEALNSIVERIPKTHRIATSESTDSNDYTDLNTGGPEVTVTTGSAAFVFMAGGLETNTTNGQARMNYQISGATSRSPVDETALVVDGITANNHNRIAQFDLVVTLTPGENTFTCKYAGSRVAPATATFRDRFIAVLPL